MFSFFHVGLFDFLLGNGKSFSCFMFFLVLIAQTCNIVVKFRRSWELRGTIGVEVIVEEVDLKGVLSMEVVEVIIRFFSCYRR